MSNVDFIYESADIDENHEKAHDREDRMIKSEKARAKRQLIKDKKARIQDKGYRGNV